MSHRYLLSFAFFLVESVWVGILSEFFELVGGKGKVCAHTQATQVPIDTAKRVMWHEQAPHSPPPISSFSVSLPKPFYVSDKRTSCRAVSIAESFKPNAYGITRTRVVWQSRSCMFSGSIVHFLVHEFLWSFIISHIPKLPRPDPLLCLSLFNESDSENEGEAS